MRKISKKLEKLVDEAAAELDGIEKEETGGTLPGSWWYGVGFCVSDPGESGMGSINVFEVTKLSKEGGCIIRNIEGTQTWHCRRGVIREDFHTRRIEIPADLEEPRAPFQKGQLWRFPTSRHTIRVLGMKHGQLVVIDSEGILSYLPSLAPALVGVVTEFGLQAV